MALPIATRATSKLSPSGSCGRAVLIDTCLPGFPRVFAFWMPNGESRCPFSVIAFRFQTTGHQKLPLARKKADASSGNAPLFSTTSFRSWWSNSARTKRQPHRAHPFLRFPVTNARRMSSGSTLGSVPAWTWIVTAATRSELNVKRHVETGARNPESSGYRSRP